MSSYVPVVDLSGWFGSDPVRRRVVANELDRAFREVGFVQVVGHGVTPAIRSAAFDAMDRFFARSEDEKRRATPTDPEIYRGYSARLSESFSYSTATARPPDLVEAYVLGADDVGRPADTGPHAANVWPDDLPGFRDAVWTYYCAARSLSEQLCRIAAMALGLGYGALDMAGNVWEWTSSNYDANSRVIRGGSWYYNAHNLRSSSRYSDGEGARKVDVGFRLVRTIR